MWSLGKSFLIYFIFIILKGKKISLILSFLLITSMAKVLIYLEIIIWKGGSSYSRWHYNVVWESHSVKESTKGEFALQSASLLNKYIKWGVKYEPKVKHLMLQTNLSHQWKRTAVFPFSLLTWPVCSFWPGVVHLVVWGSVSSRPWGINKPKSGQWLKTYIDL